jgi:hypothetical protein
MLYKEIIAVCSLIRAKHVNVLCVERRISEYKSWLIRNKSQALKDFDCCLELTVFQQISLVLSEYLFHFHRKFDNSDI